MIKRLSILIFFSFLCIATLFGQSNEVIKQLEHKRMLLQKQITQTESLLKDTKQSVSSQLNGLVTLTAQIRTRKEYISKINNDVKKINKEIKNLEYRIYLLNKDLKKKKKNYESSIKFLYKNRTAHEKLMFIFSAKDFSQMYRRLRYVKEYASYQQDQAKQIVKKQSEIVSKKREVLQIKKSKLSLFHERNKEISRLKSQETVKRDLISRLRRKQSNLQQIILKKKQQASSLNREVDRLIALEMKKARERAESKAKKTAAKKVTTVSKIDKFTMSRSDMKLSGSFTKNKGRLPMPISGPFIVVSRFGAYNVVGLKNVKLDNKGIDIQGKVGAHARSIFNGKVVAVFRLNGLLNILVRHGNYISVYCNLSSVRVKEGDRVDTKQILGNVYVDKENQDRTILHFQLRKEKSKINPKLWLNY